MNIKEYISSGILEQYLLGDLSPAEEKEVDKMMSQYPEIRQEYFLLADTFEKMALETGTPPPPALKEQLLDAITDEHPSSSQDDKERKSSGNSPLMGLAAIVGLIGLLIAAGIAYNCSLSKGELNNQLQLLNNQVEDINTQLAEKDQQINQLRNNLQIIGSPDFNEINLGGLPIAPQAFAQVFWNSSTREVYLKADQLPQPEAGKQYQLWAILEEGPLSIGVFDLPTDALLLRMSEVSNATAFAITLEPQGGVESPTMDAMYVFGNVSS
ncbi:MAG: anti-sigma factor [Saprospiraceae bacterium]|nr:anti-sigma factor [Saprospiraceae bacterium]